MAAFFFKIYIDEDDDTGERSVRAAITAGGALELTDIVDIWGL